MFPCKERVFKEVLLNSCASYMWTELCNLVGKKLEKAACDL